MRAAVLVAEGEPNTAIEVRDEPRPSVSEDAVLVRVHCASLNHLDLWIRTGRPSVPKPRIMGADAAGVIADAGAGARGVLARAGLDIGDRVIVDPGLPCGACAGCRSGDTALCESFRVLGEHTDGTHAQYVVVPALNVHRAPAHLDDAQAAALPLVFGTAWRMLFTRARVRAPERVFVWGASAGVGSAALQLCAHAGIETMASTRSAGKAEQLEALGAAKVVVTPDPDDAGRAAADAAAQWTGGRGVDVVFDHLGASAWEPSMRMLRRGGRYVTCGATTGSAPSAHITRLFWKQLSMLGSTMASRSDISDMLEFVRQHEITPRVDRAFALDDVVAAHQYLEASEQVGKVVLDVG